MAKKSKRKNIIVTNLLAVIALMIMAAALKITLHFYFFISLVVLIILYLVLGVLIELIQDKLHARKKKEDLFKRYAEGKGGTLPSQPEEYEEDDVLYDDKRDQTDMESSDKTEAEESPAFVRQTETSGQEPAADEEKTEFEEGPEDGAQAETAPAWQPLHVEPVSDDDLADSLTEGKIQPVEEPENAETISVAPIEESDDVPDSDGISEEEEAAETAEMPEETLEIETQDVFPPEEYALGPEEDELQEALAEVGAVTEAETEIEPEAETEDVPPEEDDARRSIFGGVHDFDAESADDIKNNPSIIFGSVPDTEDDMGFIPVSSNDSSPAPAKRGKVQVDAEKIDDLYTFMKPKAGFKWFRRKKKDE